MKNKIIKVKIRAYNVLGDSMNHKRLLALLLCLVIIASSKIVTINTDSVQVKDVINNTEEYKIENISEEDDNKKINIFYPVTEYESVNNVINKKIDYYRSKFDNSNFTIDKKKLEISFEEYEYKEYRSFKFIIKSNVRISHDIEEIFTVSFKGDTVIDIDYFKQKNKDILDLFYSECYNKLKDDTNIKQYSSEEWLNKGLQKDSDNYKNFIFTENAFVIIFNSYTIAPYVAGIFEVEIPYDNLSLVLN